MEYNHHHQQNALNHRGQQQQQQQHPAIEPEHLPDENDIEKLFPKCQPKQQQQQKQLCSQLTSNGRSHHQNSGRTFKNQHQQRQTRTYRSHQQHNSRRELSVRKNKANLGGEHNEQHSRYQSSRFSRQEQPIYSPEIKPNRTNYFDSSDSLDETTNKTAQHTSAIHTNLKRSETSSTICASPKLSATNSYDHLSRSISNQNFQDKPVIKHHNQHIDGSEPLTKFRQPSNRNFRPNKGSKRHTASRNFQQQSEQASRITPGVRKTNPVPLINLSSTELKSFDPNNNDTSTFEQSQSADSPRRVFPVTNNKQHESTSSTTIDDSSLAHKVEKSINRTSRGIVFLDRRQAKVSDISGAVIDGDHIGGLGEGHDVESPTIGHENPSSPTHASTGQPAENRTAQGPSSQSLLSVHSEQPSPTAAAEQQPVNSTAVLKSNDVKIENKLEKNESEPQIESQSIQSNQQPVPTLDRYQEAIETYAISNQTNLKEGPNYDDKYIDLFVYDNSVRPTLEENQSEVQEVQILSDGNITNDINCENNRVNIISVQHNASQQLLATDTGDNIVKNDTSVEELCHLEDGPIEKQKLADIKARKASDGELVTKTIKDFESTNNSIAKSVLRHHRSLGTLQTVDEKAEINIEETEREKTCTTEIEDSFDKNVGMHKASHNGPIKKGLSPPGFPQRVKSHGDSSHTYRSPSSSDDIDKIQSESSILNNLETKQPEQQQDREHSQTLLENCELKQVESNTLKTDAITNGSNSIEKNLSSAIEKVSLSDTKSKQDIPITKLRHHKLPYELCHYSVVRSTETNKDSGQHLDLERSCSSKIQFNTLSDAESETELKAETSSSSSRPAIPVKSIDDSIKQIQPSGSFVSFPKLDEGLSDEIESCDDGVEDDEVDDDDEQAMEADVEDGDIDDDIDSPIKTAIERSAHQASLNPFSRTQQSKQQSKVFNNQQSTSSTNELDGQGSRQNPTPYSNYVGNDNVDQSELKPQSGFVGQNGQPNYWLNNSSQQTTMTQPSSSGQYSTQKSACSAGSNLNMLRSMNSFRDDVKATNRLSSDTDNETDRLLGTQRNDQLQKMNNDPSCGPSDHLSINNFKPNSSSREVLIEGVLFNVKYLGSTHTECEGRGEKEDRINQAEMAVHEVKFRNGDNSSPIEVQLFISTEKIMVLDDKHRKIMMDHSLRTISYIADIGDAIVLIVRKKSNSLDVTNDLGRSIPKTTCHVFESHESHTITKSISQAFQVAYTELLKANGGDAGNYLPKELDYQEVLNSQEMSMTELDMFARKDNEREVIVPKQKGEILGISIVESGWGSVLPTAVIASLKQDGPAYRCKKLSVGDQILSINGISLVGLSQSECQEILRKTHDQRVARLSVVPCPITVEVKIKRPDTKYQLGFSVQNGVICSLLRGGIAERGGVRVGHRIMSINGTTVVDVPHDKIVTLLASSVGEIRMKTCLTSLYRHMLGEEKAVFL